MKKTSRLNEFYVTDVVGTFPKERWRLLRPWINEALCRRCWVCVTFCPEGCLLKGEGRPEVDLRFCKGCGICANECRFSAITMKEE